MNTLCATDFLTRAATFGLGVSPLNAHNWPRNLTFLEGQSHNRYWTSPLDPVELRKFFDCLLGLLDETGSVFFWAKCSNLGESLRSEEVDELTALVEATPELNGDGAIIFDRSERERLCNVLILLTRYGWSWPTDVYLVPSSFAACVMTDHHDAVHVKFASLDECEQFVSAMNDCGYPLPTEPPDWTFRQNPDGKPVE